MCLPQMTKCSLVWKGFIASALSPALVRGWEREKQGKIENERKRENSLSLLFLSNLTKTTFAHTLDSSPASRGGWIPQAPQTSVLKPKSVSRVPLQDQNEMHCSSSCFWLLFLLHFKYMSIPMAFKTVSAPGLQLQTKNQSP